MIDPKVLAYGEAETYVHDHGQKLWESNDEGDIYVAWKADEHVYIFHPSTTEYIRIPHPTEAQ